MNEIKVRILNILNSNHNLTNYDAIEKQKKIESFFENPIIFSNPKLDNKFYKDIGDEIGSVVISTKKDKFNNFTLISEKDIKLPEGITYGDYLLLTKYNPMLYFNLSIFLKELGTPKKEYLNLNDYLIKPSTNQILCKICGGILLPTSKQTRAIDEPETTKYICTNNPKHTFDPSEIEIYIYKHEHKEYPEQNPSYGDKIIPDETILNGI